MRKVIAVLLDLQDLQVELQKDQILCTVLLVFFLISLELILHTMLFQDLRDHKDLLVVLVQLAVQEIKVNQEIRDPKEPLGELDRMDHKDQGAKMD